jgi:hypothetical protein
MRFAIANAARRSRLPAVDTAKPRPRQGRHAPKRRGRQALDKDANAS